MAQKARFFADLEDPRACNRRHRLGDVIFICIAAAMGGATTAVETAQFARSKRHVIAQVIGPFDPPSHDTISRLLRQLDPNAFASAFQRFSAAFASVVQGVVAIDGKAMRRAYETALAHQPPLMVSAFASDHDLTLAAAQAGGNSVHSNEIEAAIAIVELLDLSNCTVTGDALHANRRMAEAILARGGDYVLALKGNRRHIKPVVEAAFEAHGDRASIAETNETSHGRHEVRRIEILACDQIETKPEFPGLEAIARVMSQRDGQTSVRFFLLSRSMGAEDALALVRAHWRVETTLHWSLDVTMREDDVRARKDHAPANIAFINRMALMAIAHIDDPKTSKRARIKRCAWEDDYLLRAISHMR